MKNNIHFLLYLAHFFLIKTHVLCSIKVLENNVEKYCRGGQAADDNIIRRLRIACLVPKYTNSRSQFRNSNRSKRFVACRSSGSISIVTALFHLAK